MVEHWWRECRESEGLIWGEQKALEVQKCYFGVNGGLKDAFARKEMKKQAYICPVHHTPN